MKRIAKRCFIGAVICLCIVLVFLAGVCVYLNTDHARDLIQGKVNGVIPGKIAFSDFRFSPFKGELTLKNITLKDRRNGEIAGLNALRVEVSWATLLKGTLTLKNVILEEPWANLLTDKSGKLNFLDTVAPYREEAGLKQGPEVSRASGFPIKIRVKALELAHGSIRYEMVSSGLVISVEGLDLRAEGDLLRQSARIVLQIAEGRIDSPKVNTSLARCTVSAALQEDRIDELLIEANTPASRLTASGSVRDIFKKPMFDLSLDVLAALGEVQKSLSLNKLLTGDIRARITARGELDNPEVTISLTYGGGMLSGNYVDRASLDLILKERLVTLNNLNAGIGSGNMSMQGKVDLSKAFKQGFIAPQRDFTAISYHVLLKGAGIRLEKLRSAVEHGSSGIVAFNMALSGTGLSPKEMSTDGEMEADFKEFATGTLEKPVDLNVTTSAGLKDGVVTVKQLKARSGSLSMQSSGRFDLSSGNITASLAIEAPDLTETLSSLGIGGIGGACDIRATLSGSPKRPAFDFVLQGRQLRYRHVTLGNIGANANLEQSGRLRVAMLSLENQGSLINATGSVKVFKDDFFKVDRTIPLNLSVTFKNVEMRDFFTKEPIKGTIEGQVNLDGALQSLIAKGALAGKELKAKAIRIGDCETTFRFSYGKLFVEKMEIRNHKSMLRFSGTAQVFDQKTKRVLKDPTFTLGVRGDSISVEDFVDGMKGKVSLAATMEGNFRRPRGTIDLHGTNVDLGVQRFHEIKLVCALAGKKAWFKPLQLVVAPGELIEGAGWVTLDKAYQIDLVSKGISLGNIEKIREREIGEGRILFNISGQGTFENPHLAGKITLEKPRFKGRSFNDFQVQLDLRDQVAHISGKLNFDLKGSYHVQKGDFSAFIQCSRADLEPYFRLMGQKHLSATVSGRIEARGNARAFRQTSVVADLLQMELFYKQRELFAGRNFKAVMEDGEITILSLRGSLLKEGKIDIEGKAKVHGTLSLQAEGTIPLQVARLFVDELPDLTGNVSLSAAVTGAWSHPDIRGQMELKDVGFTVPNIGQKVHNLSGTIRITPRMVTIDTLEGRMDTGRFSAGGTMELKGIRPAVVKLAIDAHALPLQVPDMMDVLLNATLQIRGTPDKSLVQGEVVILEGTYYKGVNLSLLQVVGKRKREEAPRPKEITLPFMKNMSVDISLRRRNPFVVDNNLAHLDINPDLRISGTLSNPMITGRVTIESGTVTYRRRTFDVKKGEIDFSNPYKIEPIFDIEGEVQVRKWTIRLAISGPPDKLSFTLTSDPPEEDGDILSLLMFGKTTHELIEADGGTTKSETRMLAGILATTLQDDIKKATGLDILEVETQAQEEEQVSDQVKVTIGKELSRRMTLKYAVESKDGELSQRAIAEYKLLEGILLSGFQDDKGTSGGEIFFRLEFR